MVIPISPKFADYADQVQPLKHVLKPTVSIECFNNCERFGLLKVTGTERLVLLQVIVLTRETIDSCEVASRGIGMCSLPL